VLHKTLIALAGASAIVCLPIATTALAASHSHGVSGHAMAGHARGAHMAGYRGNRYRGGYVNGPIYDSCAGYGNGYGPGYGCRGYGAPLVGGLINGVLGGYGPY
jgi:hypothetical protein